MHILFFILQAANDHPYVYFITLHRRLLENSKGFVGATIGRPQIPRRAVDDFLIIFML